MILFLIAYLVFLVAFFAYSGAAIYHLWRFGYVGDLTKVAIGIYVIVSVTIILFSFGVIFTTNWSLRI